MTIPVYYAIMSIALNIQKSGVAKMQNITESISKTLDTIENPNTVATYKNSLSYFVESLEISQDEAVSSLSLKDFIHFVKWIAEKDLSKPAKKLHVSAMKKLINYLVVNDLLEFSYSDDEKIKQAVKLYIGKSNFTPKVSPIQAVETIVDTVFQQDVYSPCKERDIAIILFLSTSGCRRSEVANMKVSDIDPETCSAMVYGGKGDKDRRIIISPNACNAIADYWEARGSANPSDPAFARHDKKSSWRNGLKPIGPQGIYMIIQRLSELAGIEEGVITPHSFRHYVATKLASKNIQLAQEQLGHSSSVTTGRYIHFSQNELAQAHKEIFS